MTWVKLDHTFGNNPKIMRLSYRSFRAYVLGLCHCGAMLTDGHIYEHVFPSLGANRAVLTELINAGLWKHQADGSVVVHDYLDHQTSRAQVEASREAARFRAIKHRKGSITPNFERSNGVTNTVSHRARSDTDQIRNPPPVSPPPIEPVTKTRKKPRTSRPPDWTWTPEQAAELRKNSFDPEHQAKKFVAHHDSHDSRFVSWTQAGWTWVHNAPEFNRNGNGKAPGLVAHEQISPPSHRPFRPTPEPKRDMQEFKVLAEEALRKVGRT